MNDEVTYCPGCEGRIYPGQSVVGVDALEASRTLWHKVCRQIIGQTNVATNFLEHNLGFRNDLADEQPK